MIFVFRDFFVDNLRWFIGGLIVLYGSLGIVGVILEKVKPIYNGNGFTFFVVEILIGLTILIFVKEYSTVCVIWAVWSILRESVELKEIVSGELHPLLTVVSGIESIAVIVLSIMLITEPGRHHAVIHTYLLCVELILTSSLPMLSHYVLKKRVGEHSEISENEVQNQTEQVDQIQVAEESPAESLPQ